MNNNIVGILSNLEWQKRNFFSFLYNRYIQPLINTQNLKYMIEHDNVFQARLRNLSNETSLINLQKITNLDLSKKKNLPLFNYEYSSPKISNQIKIEPSKQEFTNNLIEKKACNNISTKNFLKYIFKKFMKFLKTTSLNSEKFEKNAKQILSDNSSYDNVKFDDLFQNFKRYIRDVEIDTHFRRKTNSIKKIKKSYSYAYISVEQIKRYLDGETLNDILFKGFFKYFLQFRAISEVLNSELSSPELKHCYVRKIHEYIGLFFL